MTDIRNVIANFLTEQGFPAEISGDYGIATRAGNHLTILIHGTGIQVVRGSSGGYYCVHSDDLNDPDSIPKLMNFLHLHKHIHETQLELEDDS
jgi:hypothetical protein